MIHGIGTDIVLVERIRDLLARYGERFARRVLGPDELAEYRRRHGRGEHGPAYAARYLAKRFAAKEAFAKAAGTGLRHPLHLRSIAVTHSELGQPGLRFNAELSSWLQQHGVTASHLSLSDEQDFVIAYVILEKA
jgi:holo-[acyl-carrier protein] synthase